MKKKLALFLAGIMAAAMIAGCGDTASSSAPKESAVPSVSTPESSPSEAETVEVTKTKTTTVHGVAMIEGAIAQPAVIYPYKEPEKIPLSNDYGVSMFFDYGTKALTPDLIFTYSTSVTST